MKALLWRAAPKVWTALKTPAAKRGTWAAELGTLTTAIIMGLLYWWVRSHH
jgi:hypothetical protein